MQNRKDKEGNSMIDWVISKLEDLKSKRNKKNMLSIFWACNNFIRFSQQKTSD